MRRRWFLTILAVLLVVNASSIPSAKLRRTSPIVNGHCIVVEESESTDPGTYLARMEATGPVKVLLLSRRLNEAWKDKIVVKGNVGVVLLQGSAERYTHFPIKWSKFGYTLYKFPEGAVLGSSRALVFGDFIVGTMWLSPDYPAGPANLLYVLGPIAFRIGRVPSALPEYDLAKTGPKTFRLVHMGPKKDVIEATWPMRMKNGYWQLWQTKRP